MLIDCDTCAVRGINCGDCVISVLLGPPAAQTELDDVEFAAIGTLASAGLVPPLRLVSGGPDRKAGDCDTRHKDSA